MFRTLSRWLAGCKKARPASRKRSRTILTLEQLEARECPAVDFWIAPVLGDWHDGANWADGSAPGPWDDVVFDGNYGNGVARFMGNGFTQMANSITLEANYTGELHLHQPSAVDIGFGGLTLRGGAIEQMSGMPINILGDFNWSGGNLNVNSPFLAAVNQAGGTFTASGTSNKTTGSDINLKGGNGVVSLPGAKLTFMKNAGISIDNGSTMNLVDGELDTTGTGVITNKAQGTLQKTAGTAAFNTDLPIVNSGTFELQNGILVIHRKAANASFEQTGANAITELGAATTLEVKQGFFMNKGHLWTSGLDGSLSTISGGDVLIEGGIINLLHGTPNGTGRLHVSNDLTIRGTAEYHAKIDSTNLTEDTITASTITLGGNSVLKTVSINLVLGKVALNKTWTIFISGAANIAGDFNTKVLDFNDGTGKKYTAAKNGKNYEVKS